MTAKEKAEELIKRFGKKTSIEIAEMILEEHKQYRDPYTNAEKTKYWADVRDLLNISDVEKRIIIDNNKVIRLKPRMVKQGWGSLF